MYYEINRQDQTTATIQLYIVL